MKSDFVLFPECLGPALCDDLLSYMEIKEGCSREAPCYDDGGNLYGFRHYWALNDVPRDVSDTLFRLADKANNNFGLRFDSIEYLQFNTYLAHPLSLLPPHNDVIGRSPKNRPCRKISMTVQLTDPGEYDDCDFNFVPQIEMALPDKNELRKRGSVIFFPSYLLHYVTSCTRGKRIALVGWFTGPDFQ